MNTTQNIQRIIAAGLLAASAGLALSSCAGQRHITEPDSELTTDAQIAEQRAEYRDLAERRSEESRDRHPHVRRSTSISPSAATVSADRWPAMSYHDQAERRVGVGGPAATDDYSDLAERRLRFVRSLSALTDRAECVVAIASLVA